MGLKDIKKGDCIYLDTNVIIYALEGYQQYLAQLTELLNAVDSGKIKAVTSELTLAETLIKPMMDNNATLQEIYIDALQSTDSFKVVPITRRILIEAAKLRSASNILKLPDAIHLATAVTCGCNIFLTNDRRIKSISDITVVTISEELP